jgi:hypothetical protein
MRIASETDLRVLFLWAKVFDQVWIRFPEDPPRKPLKTPGKTFLEISKKFQEIIFYIRRFYLYLLC